MKFRAYNGDCIKGMKKLADNSVDLVLTDPPYGTTACKWDNVIPFEPMWAELKRIVKPDGAICLFGSEPFSSHLRLSNLKMFKYDWIWLKSRSLGFVDAKLKPLNASENIHIFSIGKTSNCNKNNMPYYPQGLIEYGKIVNGVKEKNNFGHFRPSQKSKHIQKYTNYPKNILSFRSAYKTVHPTQKPVPLLGYLIKTYTLENETVLDFTAGSFSTGVACKNTKRNFIGIEKDKTYFDIGIKRMKGII